MTTLHHETNNNNKRKYEKMHKENSDEDEDITSLNDNDDNDDESSSYYWKIHTQSINIRNLPSNVDPFLLMNNLSLHISQVLHCSLKYNDIIDNDDDDYDDDNYNRSSQQHCIMIRMYNLQNQFVGRVSLKPDPYYHHHHQEEQEQDQDENERNNYYRTGMLELFHHETKIKLDVTSIVTTLKQFFSSRTVEIQSNDNNNKIVRLNRVEFCLDQQTNNTTNTDTTTTTNTTTNTTATLM